MVEELPRVIEAYMFVGRVVGRHRHVVAVRRGDRIGAIGDLNPCSLAQVVQVVLTMTREGYDPVAAFVGYGSCEPVDIVDGLLPGPGRSNSILAPGVSTEQ